jgi:outer membrane protein assembly factor BamB
MMKLLYGLLLLCGCSATPPDAGERDWLLFRGDAALSGQASVALPDKPALRWTYKSYARAASSPVVYNQVAYWCDKRGQVYGVDIRGNRCFAYDFATAVEAAPAIRDSVLYIGRIDGFMSALSLARQDTLWNFETLGQISASPNIVAFEGKQAVVFGSYDSYLYCVDRESGREIRRFESGYYINGATAALERCFVSGGCDAWVRIIDGSSGLVSDSLELETYIPASPAVDGAYAYIADHSGNVYELLVRNGKITRSRKIVTATDGSSSCVSVPALSPSTLFILSADRYLYAVDRSSGAVRWKYLQKGSSGESSPVVCGHKIISCSQSGVVSLLDAANGRLLWEYDTGEPITACPAVIKGYFYILTAKGTLFCFGNG